MAFVNLVVNTGFSYIVPFYPVLAYDNAHLDYTMIGVLMSINSVGSTLSAYVFGSMIQMWGRKRFLLISLFCQSLVMVLYALVYFLTDNYWVFVSVSIFMRMSEGVVRSIYAVTTFNYLNIFWKDTFA
jgi:MFS family permease